MPRLLQTAGERDGMLPVPRALLRTLRPAVSGGTRPPRPVSPVLRTPRVPRE